MHKNEGRASNPDWRASFREAMDKLKTITETGIRKSEKLTKVAGHRVRKGILERELGKHFQDLGERVFVQIRESKVDPSQLQDILDQIDRKKAAIEEEVRVIEILRTGQEGGAE